MSNKLVIFKNKKTKARCYIFSKEVKDGVTYITVKYQASGKVFPYTEERFNKLFEA